MWPAARFTLAQLAAWGSFFVFWPAGMLAWAWSLRGLGRRWGLAAALTAPWPLVTAASSALGAISYARGEAVMIGVGFPAQDGVLLHEATRARSGSSGCMVTGAEVFTNGPNNAVVWLLTAALGPQPGAYLGPLPDREQALALAEEARLVEGTQLPLGQRGWMRVVRHEGDAAELQVVVADTAMEAKIMGQQDPGRIVVRHFFEDGELDEAPPTPTR